MSLVRYRCPTSGEEVTTAIETRKDVLVRMRSMDLSDALTMGRSNSVFMVTRLSCWSSDALSTVVAISWAHHVEI